MSAMWESSQKAEVTGWPDQIWIEGVYYRHECDVPFNSLKRKFVCPCGRTWVRMPKNKVRS